MCNSDTSNECLPHQTGFNYDPCSRAQSPCGNLCGKSNKKCYCTTTLFPKPDPIRKARRTFEKELQPINNNLSDLQERVRSMYINEMNDCICGAAIPDNPFPTPITCNCSAHHMMSHRSNSKKSCCPRKPSCCSSMNSHTSASSAFDQRPSPFVCVGSIPFARTTKSCKRSKSRKSHSKSKCRSTKSLHSHKSKKRHKSSHKRHGHKSRKSHKSASTRKSSKKGKKTKDPDKELKPLTESQHEFMCMRLKDLARNMFYKGVVSHYLNQNSPVYYHNVCDCSSMDALADPRDRTDKKDLCALTTSNFPLRPGQSLTTDPDDTSLFAEYRERKSHRKHRHHKSRKSRSPSVIKLKLRLKRSKSSSKRRGRKSRRSSKQSRNSRHSRSSSRSGSHCSRSRSGGESQRKRSRSGSARNSSNNSRNGSSSSAARSSSGNQL